MDNVSSVWVDAGGGSRINLLHVQGGTTGAASVAALGLGSNASWLSYWNSNVTVQVPTPTVAVYPSTRDLAVLVFTDGTDNVAVDLPAPKSAMFLADQETVDPADPTGAIAALLAILTTAAGANVTAFVGGYRR